MADETNNTEVAPVEEKRRGGIRLPHVIGGAAGGYFAHKYTNSSVINGGIREALKDGGKPSDGYKKGLEDVLAGKSKDSEAIEAAVKSLEEGIAGTKKITKFKLVEDAADKAKLNVHFTPDGGKEQVIKGFAKPANTPANILGVEITDAKQIEDALKQDGAAVVTHAKAEVAAAASKLKGAKTVVEELQTHLKDVKKITDVEITKGADEIHKLTYKFEGKAVEHELGKTLPKGQTVGKITDAAKSEAAVKSAAADLEKTLVKDIRTAGKGKFGLGAMSTMGKTKVIGLTVAGVVVGGGILGAIFRGSHAKKVEQGREAEATPAR